MHKAFAVLVLFGFLAFGQSIQAQQPADGQWHFFGESDDLKFDPQAKLFHWLHVGTRPVIKGGVPTREAFAQFVQSEAFAKAMTALGIENRIAEARDLVIHDEFSEAQLSPNSSASLFLEMAFDGARVQRPVIWSGNGPLDVWVLRLNGLRLDIPKGCANVGITTDYKTQIKTVTVEKRVEVPVEVPVEKIVEKVVTPPCDPNWSWGVVGDYSPKHTHAKKVKFSDLLERDDFWVMGSDDQGTRAKVINLIKQEDATIPKKDRVLGQKVQLAVVLYNICDGRMRIYWYREGWHWKEFILGFVAGFAAGWFSHMPGVISKDPFLPPPNSGRPDILAVPGWNWSLFIPK
jgi:hypothetical protein